MMSRIFVILFACLFATSLFAQDKPAENVGLVQSPERILETIRDLIGSQQKILLNENEAVADRARAFAVLMLACGILTKDGDIRIGQLVDSIEKQLASTEEILEGQELSVIKFDIVRKRIDALRLNGAGIDTADKVRALQEAAKALADMGEAMNKKVDETKELQNEVGRIEQAYILFINSLVEISEMALGGGATANRIDKAVKELDIFTENEGLNRISLDARKAGILRRALSELGQGGSVNERAELFEERLKENPDDFESWREWTEWRLINLNMDSMATKNSYDPVLERLAEAQKSRTAIEKELTYLHAYYSGWVNERFEHHTESLEFYELARLNATNERDMVRALAKVTEQKIKLTKISK